MTKEISGGLVPTPEDTRDFSFSKTFGSIEPVILPKELIVSEPLKIKDQSTSDLCSAFAITAVSEDQEGIELSPEYQFAKTKQLSGEYVSWGADLRTACKSIVKFGSIPERNEELSLEQNGRDAVANWNNWSSGIDALAQKYRKKSYFVVDGQYDTFDNIRSALFKYKNEHRTILTGCTWESEWTGAPNGIIPKKQGTPLFGHAFKVFGWKTFGSEPYLMAQLSNGKGIGDYGIFYFPREVVNKKFTYGAYMFMDISPEAINYKSPLQRFLEWIKSFWQQL